jgi:hypothetical protein
VLRALDRDREKRHATARELAEALRTAASAQPCTLAEIADAVKTRCGDRLLERKRQVATAVSSRKGVADPDMAETLERPVATSMEIRQQSVTLDLRGEARARSLVEADDSVSEAAATRDLRRDVAATRTTPPPERLSDDDIDLAPLRQRSHLKTTILVAVTAAAVTAAIVVTVMMMGQDREPVSPPPPQPAPTQPAPVVQPADAAIEEPPLIDAAEPSVPPRKSVPARSKSKPTKPDPSAEPSPSSMRTDIEKGAEDLRKTGEDIREAAEKLKRDLGR